MPGSSARRDLTPAAGAWLARMVDRTGGISLDWSPAHTFRLQPAVHFVSDYGPDTSYAVVLVGHGRAYPLDNGRDFAWIVQGGDAFLVVRGMADYLARCRQQADLVMAVEDFQRCRGPVPATPLEREFIYGLYDRCQRLNGGVQQLPPLSG